MYILIIEDEEGVASFLRKGFLAETWNVDVAESAEIGLPLALSGKHDAIILDLMLPGQDGFDFLVGLRREGVSTPVLILSAKGSVKDRVKGLDLGADDYLPKPFAFSELLARIRSLVRRDKSLPKDESVLRLVDLQLDPVTRTVTRGDTRIELSNKEFALLHYLLRSKGRVLSRALITDQIWGMLFDSGTNIVDVVINRLRRKIDDGFDPPLIHTVRGIGYVMKEPDDKSFE